MDAISLLGSLMGNNAVARGGGGGLLGSLLGGVMGGGAGGMLGSAPVAARSAHWAMCLAARSVEREAVERRLVLPPKLSWGCSAAWRLRPSANMRATTCVVAMPLRRAH